MSEQPWVRVADRLPPKGALVEVITESGDQRPLVYDSNLWWLPDKSMYCYFTPTHWRLQQSPAESVRRFNEAVESVFSARRSGV